MLPYNGALWGLHTNLQSHVIYQLKSAASLWKHWSAFLAECGGCVCAWAWGATKGAERTLRVAWKWTRGAGWKRPLSAASEVVGMRLPSRFETDLKRAPRANDFLLRIVGKPCFVEFWSFGGVWYIVRIDDILKLQKGAVLTVIAGENATRVTRTRPLTWCVCW